MGGASSAGLAMLGMISLALVAKGASAASGPPSTGGGGGGGTPSPCGTLDAGIDQATATAVCQAITNATASTCSALVTFAGTLKAKWPVAAALCLAKASALGCSGGSTIPCAPGASILGAASSAIENDLAYALGTYLNGSGILARDEALGVDLSWWIPPGGGGGSGQVAAPFPLEAGVVYLTQAQAVAMGAGGWQTPAQWPAYMTTQAEDVNNSAGTAAGTYYLADTTAHVVYSATKGGGNTTLGTATTSIDWTKLPTAGGGGGGSTPSTLQTLLGDLSKFALGVDALQRDASANGFASPPGLPGRSPGVLDAQTLVTLAGWLQQQGDTDVLGGSASGVLGAMQGALPGFLSAVKTDLAQCGAGSTGGGGTGGGSTGGSGGSSGGGGTTGGSGGGDPSQGGGGSSGDGGGGDPSQTGGQQGDGGGGDPSQTGGT